MNTEELTNDVDVVPDAQPAESDAVDNEIVPSEAVEETEPVADLETGQELETEGEVEEGMEVDTEGETEASVESGGGSVSVVMPDIPVYDENNPLPVILMEQEEPALLSVSGSPYPGTIGSTYLDYFQGVAEGLPYGSNYVAYRSGQYEYMMFFGEDLEYANGRFTGTGDYVRFYTRDGISMYTGSDSISLSVGTGVVYSNLGDYAVLTRGGTGLEFSALLFAVGFAVVYSVCHDIFDYVMSLYRK